MMRLVWSTFKILVVGSIILYPAQFVVDRITWLVSFIPRSEPDYQKELVELARKSEFLEFGKNEKKIHSIISDPEQSDSTKLIAYLTEAILIERDIQTVSSQTVQHFAKRHVEEGRNKAIAAKGEKIASAKRLVNNVGEATCINSVESLMKKSNVSVLLGAVESCAAR